MATTLVRFFAVNEVAFSGRYKTRELRTALFSVFFNISPSNFAIVLILKVMSSQFCASVLLITKGAPQI